MAVGIRGQFIYVNPPLRLVIVKTAANDDYTNDQRRYTRTDLALFRTIARTLTP
jgi:CubicO group peptidase (beta-lactamase class C family)